MSAYSLDLFEAFRIKNKNLAAFIPLHPLSKNKTSNELFLKTYKQIYDLSLLDILPVMDKLIHWYIKHDKSWL